jgi:hypothetical protein
MIQEAIEKWKQEAEQKSENSREPDARRRNYFYYPGTYYRRRRSKSRLRTIE